MGEGCLVKIQLFYFLSLFFIFLVLRTQCWQGFVCLVTTTSDENVSTTTSWFHINPAGHSKNNFINYILKSMFITG